MGMGYRQTMTGLYVQLSPGEEEVKFSTPSPDCRFGKTAFDRSAFRASTGPVAFLEVYLWLEVMPGQSRRLMPLSSEWRIKIGKSSVLLNRKSYPMESLKKVRVGIMGISRIHSQTSRVEAMIDVFSLTCHACWD